MPNLYGGNPFQNVNEQEELYRQEVAAAQARALGLNPSMLGRSNPTAASPYYGQAAYGGGGGGYIPPQQTSMYSALQSPAEAMYGRPSAGYGYASASPDHQAFQNTAHYGRGGGYYSQQSQEQAMIDRAYMQQQLQQQEQLQREEDEAAAFIAVASARKAASQVSYLSQPQQELQQQLQQPQQEQPETPQTKPSPQATPTPAPAKLPGKAGGRGKGSGGRGGGRGRGRGAAKKTSSPKSAEKTKEAVPPAIDPPNGKWFMGTVPLGLPEDKYWLSELQVFLRHNFAEAFGASEEDIAAPMHGRNKPIALGQVGIRCIHCKNDPPSERGQQATSYPSLISGIYNSVQQMLRLHYDCCMSMPAEVRERIEHLKLSSSARGGRKQYWIDSAKRLGLLDTPYGIYFSRDPAGPIPPLEGPLGPPGRKKNPVITGEVAAEIERKREAEEKKRKREEAAAEAAAQAAKEEAEPAPPPKKKKKKEGSGGRPPTLTGAPVPHLPPDQLYPLVYPDDQDLISDYLYLTMEQMQPAKLTEADKVGCYKGRDVGFAGLACKHCIGQAGCGRYFPASEASLSQTTTSQTIMNHVRNCRRCPIEIRESLELMRRARMGPDGKKAEKPKHGGRKVFFHRLWCRIQRIPIGSEDETPKRRKWGRKKSTSTTKARRKSLGASDTDDYYDGAHFDDSVGSGEETETEKSDAGEDSDGSVPPMDRKPKAKRSSSRKKVKKSRWYEGVVRLAKADDPHWMTEMDCFVRNELVELFTYDNNEDSLMGYAGRKEPARGQVGIRCVCCARLPKAEQPGGSVHFPELLSSIETKVGDMVRLHFPSCPAMPDDLKETFRSLRSFGPKVNDCHQYWIDSARDIGLSDMSSVRGGWGITFRRDPMQPSPADDIDRENAGTEEYTYDKCSLLQASDKGLCTDHIMLLLRQVKVCRFKKTDRRGAPGASARGRDRVIGYPGLCCIHCAASKTSFGRYFPVSPKNLTDHTANSLLMHMQSCSRCPEEIRASLAYLSHRSVLQKVELRGSWKKAFFKRVWDRLHVERAWDDGGGGGKEEEEEEHAAGASQSSGEHYEDAASHGSDSFSEDEEAAISSMADLIKAAGVWLSEQETPSDATRRTGRAQARALPTSSSASRPSPAAFSPSAARGGRPLPSVKRSSLGSDS